MNRTLKAELERAILNRKTLREVIALIAPHVTCGHCGTPINHGQHCVFPNAPDMASLVAKQGLTLTWR